MQEGHTLESPGKADSCAETIGSLNNKVESKTTRSLSFLTLGDGDFSFSLDVARFLVSSYSNLSCARHRGTKKYGSIRLMATGIDSREEVVEKYRDSPFLLKQLQSLDNSTLPCAAASSSCDSCLLFVDVMHKVNAIATDIPSPSDDLDTPTGCQTQPLPADHVLFNHPHLGTEDAALHARLLCHLFHAVANVWLKPFGALFHLTLVDGQFERWKCLDAAHRHGLVLVGKRPFQPPIPIQSPESIYHPGSKRDDDTSSFDHSDQKRKRPISYYQYRRHQTGRSFESRRSTGESQTYSFARNQDKHTPEPPFLPWQRNHDDVSNDQRHRATGEGPSLANLLPCPYCDKLFREERSRKCHLRDKHDQIKTKQKKHKRDNHQDEIQALSTVISILCRHCTRTFESEQALNDHVRAKHSGIHRDMPILPDWHKRNDQMTKVVDPTNATLFGSCAICGMTYKDSDHALRHSTEFVPKPLLDESSKVFQCVFCSKRFRDNRAKMQHENFCTNQKPG